MLWGSLLTWRRADSTGEVEGDPGSHPPPSCWGWKLGLPAGGLGAAGCERLFPRVGAQDGCKFIESQSPLGWKSLLRPSGPALLSQNHIPKHHTCVSFKYFLEPWGGLGWKGP